MNSNPPRMNQSSSELLDEDLNTSKEMIMEWLPIVAKEIHSQYQSGSESLLEEQDWTMELHHIIKSNPDIIELLRALCIRHIGRLQFADFSGFKSDSKFKRLEDGKGTSFTTEECISMSGVIKRELNPDWADWILEQRKPSEDEISIAKQVTSLRLMDRKIATEIRYLHEPRQTAKLVIYLDSLGYVKVPGKEIQNPRKMKQGTYTFGCQLESTQENGEILQNPVDVILMPFSDANDMLPIFIEAKSMTDKANPNKRQKEEGKKIQNLRRRWQRPEGEEEKNQEDPFIYVIEVGGTIPKRYLETEENQGIDWFFEDRPEDLDVLLDWYLSLST